MSEIEAGGPEEKAPELVADQAAVNPEEKVTTSGTALQVQMVPFHEDQVEAVQMPSGEVYALPKRICENIGVNWKTQFRKLQRDPMWGMVIMTIPSQGGVQETCVIPITKVAFWVSGIQENKVSPEIREKMRLYREECATVLDRHFRGQPSNREDRFGSSAAEIGAAVAKAMIPVIDRLDRSMTLNSTDIARLDERVTKLESKVAYEPVKDEPYMTVYGYCDSRGIKTNTETNRLHTVRLKKIIDRENLNIVPRLIRIGESKWPLYHWPVSFLDRYFSHSANRDLAMRNRRFHLFGRPVDRAQASK